MDQKMYKNTYRLFEFPVIVHYLRHVPLLPHVVIYEKN